jgi:hypothetical protein
MSRTSITKTLISMTVAGLVSVALLSPANASNLQGDTSVDQDSSARATADRAEGTGSRNPSIVLTSHLPWLAPVGHRQPRPSDLPQDDGLSTWERQQQQLDHELNRKLIICRGC